MKWSQQDNLRLVSIKPSLQRRKGSCNLEAKVEMVRVFEGGLIDVI